MSFDRSRSCDEVLRKVQLHILKAADLAKPKPGELLYIYLTIPDSTISAILGWEELKAQLPRYYTSKSPADAETKYSAMKKLVLALVSSSRKLRLILSRSYHPIRLEPSCIDMKYQAKWWNGKYSSASLILAIGKSRLYGRVYNLIIERLSHGRKIWSVDSRSRWGK